ncbi:MAG: Transcriptional regulator [Candidatus Roizmanbacteria bacterium GW2011_GWA2_36_23]|uniref:Transcriptional regulator n=1 Tax=Candidatus Roizmanbacteria bacterium GW2011_GWA2_36_23 TaxID=1618480 RepID=A0A0G0E5D2_9BACT|nr:MAG: Transcriptional regulator [Candidatus Roizmanbacteria bacterium GW2011_GWA2_36_23]
MLQNIIPSKARRKILELFFHHPEQNFYLRKIVRDIDEEVNAVKRELDILSEEKLLLKERRLNKIFYFLNKNYHLHDEFMRIFTKTGAMVTTIYKNLPKIGKIKYIALSTKFAKKTFIKDDEIYILLVGIIVIPEIESILKDEEKNFGKEINYTVMNDDEFLFRKKNNDPFIWRFLKQPKIMLVGNEEELLK